LVCILSSPWCVSAAGGVFRSLVSLCVVSFRGCVSFSCCIEHLEQKLIVIFVSDCAKALRSHTVIPNACQ
jgi:hypothetical protein